MSYTAFLDMISTMLPLESVINSTGTFCFSLFFLNNTLVLTDIYINIGPWDRDVFLIDVGLLQNLLEVTWRDTLTSFCQVSFITLSRSLSISAAVTYQWKQQEERATIMEELMSSQPIVFCWQRNCLILLFIKVREWVREWWERKREREMNKEKIFQFFFIFVSFLNFFSYFKEKKKKEWRKLLITLNSSLSSLEEVIHQCDG